MAYGSSGFRGSRGRSAAPARSRAPRSPVRPSPQLVLLAALERAGLALAFGAGTGVAEGAEGAGAGCAASECAVIAAELRSVYAALRSLRLAG